MPPPPLHKPTAEELLQHLGFVRRLAHALVHDPHVADDVVQDAMLAAIQRPPRLEKGLRSWLRGVVKKRIQFHYRSEGRRVGHEGTLAASRGAAEAERTDGLLEGALLRAEQSRLIAGAVVGLREPYRSAIVLRYLEGLPPRDIARTLELPVNTVHTHLQRGLGILREELDRRYGERETWQRAVAPLAASGARLVTATGVTVGTIGIWVAALATAAAVLVLVVRHVNSEGAGDARPTDQAAADVPLDPAEAASPGRTPDVGSVVLSPVSNERTVVATSGLSVRVLDAEGDAVANAGVSTSAGALSDLTDEKGIAELETTRAVFLWVTHPDFVPALRRVSRGKARYVEVVLAKPEASRLRVVDAETGQGIVDARVSYTVKREHKVGETTLSAAGPIDIGLRRRLSTWRSTRKWMIANLRELEGEPVATDGNGEAWIEGPAGGEVRLNVDAPGYVAARFVAVPVGEEPAVVELEPAATLRLVRGEGAGARILRLRLLSTSGRDPSDGWLTMEPWRYELVLDTLPPGGYDVLAVAHDAAPADDPSLHGLSVAASLAGRLAHRSAVIAARESVELSLFGVDGVDGTVRIVGSRQPGELVVYLETESADAFHPPSVTLSRLWAVAEPVSPTSDEYRFTALLPGQARIHVAREGEILLRQTIVVPDEDGFELELALGGGVLEVTLIGVDEDDRADAAHILVGPQGHASVDSRTWKRSGSEVVFDALVPGRYELWTTTIRRGEVERTIHREIEVIEGFQRVAVGGPEDVVRRLTVVLTDGESGGIFAALYSDDGRFILDSERGFGRGEDVAFDMACARYHVVANVGDAVFFREVDLVEDYTIELDPTGCRAFRLRLTLDGNPLGAEEVGIGPPLFAGFEDRMFIAEVTSLDGEVDLCVEPGRYSVWTARGHVAEVELTADLRELEVALQRP